MLRELLSSTVRGEMRKRVDQVLKAGEQWTKATNELKESLNRLSDAIEKNEVKPELISPIKKSVQNLSKKTTRMRKAITNYTKTLGKIAAQVKE